MAGEVDAVRARELDRFRNRGQLLEAERSARPNRDAVPPRCVAEDALRKRASEAVAGADEDDLERPPAVRDRVALVDPVEVRQRRRTLRSPLNPHTGRVSTSSAARRVPRAGVLLALAARDYRLARSYRVAFALDLVLGVVSLAIFYFISRSLGDPSPASLGSAPTYFAFAAVGIAVTVVMESSAIGLSTRLREEQMTGTLEALVAQPLTVSELAFGLTAYSFAFATLRAGLYVLAAGVLLDLDLSETNWLAFVLMLFVTGVALTAIGILLGGVVLLVKRARALPGLVTLVLGLLGGAYFPISALPGPLEAIGTVVPTRFAFDGLRAAVFGGGGWETDLLALAAFSAVALPSAVYALALAFRFSRSRGSLAQF